MIYISSDWHVGDYSFEEIEEMLASLNKEDVVLLLGDICGAWRTDEGAPWFVERLEQAPCTIAMIDGNHDDINYLDRLPVGEFGGAKGHWIGRNLFHICRGEVLCLEGLTFLAVGGGLSGESFISNHPEIWQAREMPSPEEFAHVRESCAAHGYSFDYVLSHAAPLSVIQKYDLGVEYNELHSFLDELAAKVKRKGWFFGHYHREVQFENGYELVFRRFVRLPSRDEEKTSMHLSEREGKLLP